MEASSAPRKVKFAPKGPPRREAKSKPPQPTKSEIADRGESDDEIDEALLRRVNDHLTRRLPKAAKKSSVQVAFAHGVASSTSTRTYGENAIDPLFEKDERLYKEPWDYHHSYYPTTLPLRRPFSGDPEVLDKEEFGEATSPYDENAIPSASDLGLLEEGDAAKMFFFQLPANIPFSEQPTTTDRMEAADSIKLPGNDTPASAKDKAIAGHSTPKGTVASAMAKGKEAPGDFSMVSASRKGKEKADSSTSPMQANASMKICSLKELPAGCMGKMLVYKSGAVKLKLGDILYDVSPGSDCVFAQEIMAVNRVKKQCCDLGDIRKRAIVTPEIDSMVD